MIKMKPQPSNEEPEVNTTAPDGAVVSQIAEKLKLLDPNKYATRKTVAGGLLDIALLTANASQLKYILEYGHAHPFYTLVLTLLIVSICLQVLNGILMVALGAYYNLNKARHQRVANILNNIGLGINVIVVALGILISTFIDRKPENGTNVLT